MVDTAPYVALAWAWWALGWLTVFPLILLSNQSYS
jgi:hypothetical protein